MCHSANKTNKNIIGPRIYLSTTVLDDIDWQYLAELGTLHVPYSRTKFSNDDNIHPLISAANDSARYRYKNGPYSVIDGDIMSSTSQLLLEL